jgi:Zn-dependent peptidase ImmA (M78 family)
MLTWAMHRAGKTVDDLKDALPKLPKWLSMEAEPTVKQLEAFSRKVYLPFGYLFLPEPPKEIIPFPYFRQGNKAPENSISLNVADTIRNIQQRQLWLSEYLKDDDMGILPFVGKFSTDNTVDEIVNDIRTNLGLAQDWSAFFKDTSEAFRSLVTHTEEIGVVVVINGVVGNSTRRKIDSEECRGFVLVDDYCPFLFINNSDAQPAKLFTLIHELAHVWLGKSAGFDTNKLLPANDPVEQLCDQIAAEFLVPAKVFKLAWQEIPNPIILSRRFKVSKIVIARRALDLGFITKAEFFQWYNKWQEEWAQIKANSGGGDFYNNQPNRVSLRFAAFVERAVHSGRISYREAYKLTGLSGDTYHHFINTKL